MDQVCKSTMKGIWISGLPADKYSLQRRVISRPENILSFLKMSNSGEEGEGGLRLKWSKSVVYFYLLHQCSQLPLFWHYLTMFLKTIGLDTYNYARK